MFLLPPAAAGNACFHFGAPAWSRQTTAPSANATITSVRAIAVEVGAGRRRRRDRVLFRAPRDRAIALEPRDGFARRHDDAVRRLGIGIEGGRVAGGIERVFPLSGPGFLPKGPCRTAQEREYQCRRQPRVFRRHSWFLLVAHCQASRRRVPNAGRPPTPVERKRPSAFCAPTPAKTSLGHGLGPRPLRPPECNSRCL